MRQWKYPRWRDSLFYLEFNKVDLQEKIVDRHLLFRHGILYLTGNNFNGNVLVLNVLGLGLAMGDITSRKYLAMGHWNSTTDFAIVIVITTSFVCAFPKKRLKGISD